VLARAHDSGASHRPVERAVRLAARGKRLVLAVSGGRDSMAMLRAAALSAHGSVAVVATFDHRTGAAATRAASLVAREATALGFPVVVGHASRAATSEEEWRDMRLAFLNEVARQSGAVVATAHTKDDQVETVLMRVLRGTGPRGLAGLYASSDSVRPLLGVPRADVAAYANTMGVRWIEDPTNASSRHLRNRVRRDLLPAIAHARPDFAEDLLALARRAAHWRGVLDALVSDLMPLEVRRESLVVPAGVLARLAASELALLWPSIAARAGARTDWRGTDRLVAFTRDGRVGSRIPLSGGWEVGRTREAFELRRARVTRSGEAVPLTDGLVVGAWAFAAANRLEPGAWTARLPSGIPLTVRAWRAGDRMIGAADGGPRRVKRFLSDAHVSGTLRPHWPVVLAGDEIVWIPGIRRGHAVAERPGRPGVLFRCEFTDR
jgi:tRNA(Ile)-lysidine synthase